MPPASRFVKEEMPSPLSSRLLAIIPAYNEAETIGGVLDSLLQQTRLPDAIHLVVNNTSDDSVEIASHYAGPHTRMTPTGEQSTLGDAGQGGTRSTDETQK